MAWRGWILACIVALVAIAGAGLAESTSEDVGDHTVTVYVLEIEETHSESESETSSFEYHQVDRTFGVWVDDQGANATVTNFTRDSSYDDGTFENDRTTEGLQLEVDGQAAGYTIDHLVQAYLVETEYDFGPDNNGQAANLIVNYWLSTRGEDVRVRNTMSSGTGAGDIVGPTWGDVVYASGGFYARNGVSVDDLSAGVNGGPSADAVAGDWNAVLASATVSEYRCQGFQCDGTGVSQTVCLLGYRPPLLFDCLI